MYNAPHPLLRAVPTAPLPIEALLLGKRVGEAAELLPRLFNLCRAAQVAAARLVFRLGLPGDDGALARDISRDHVLRLAVTLPARLSKAPMQVRIGEAARETLFGPAGFPQKPADFDAYLSSGIGIAPLLYRINGLFAPGEAVTPVLETPKAGRVICDAAFENTVAARHAGHPVMQHIEDTWGRGPLWRVVARAFDIDACAQGALPQPRLVAPGVAVVPAARGLYGVSARVRDDRVAAFTRVTPTDHLLCSGGVMDHALASLPATKHGLAPLLVDILDPCSPVRIEGGPVHA